MAAFTSKASGNWSSSGQTTWNEAGVPGSGDTVSIASPHVVTVPDGYTATIGATGQATGYTALTIANGGQLVVGGGASGSLRLQGDISGTTGSTSPTNQVRILAGASIVFVPSSGQRIKIGLGNQKHITFEGSSGSRCALNTDATALSGGGLKGWISLTGGGANNTTGLKSATYTDFTDLDDGSTAGAWQASLYAAATDFTLTNCTFTRCGGCKVAFGSSNTAGNVTISGNTWASSVGTSYGNGTTFMRLQINNDKTGGARTYSGNVSDLVLDYNDTRDMTFSGSVFGASSGPAIALAAGTNAKKWTSFDNCLVYTDTESNQLVTAYGDITNCLMLNGKASNPHFISVYKYGSSAISGNVIEAYNASNDGAGDALMWAAPNSGATMIGTAKFNLVLPTYGVNKTAGTMTVFNSAVAGEAVIEHNTIYGGSQHAVQANESSGGIPAGAISYFRGNLCWAGTSSTSYGKLADVAGSGSHTTDIVSPSNANYNAGYNLQSAVPWPSSGYTNDGNGYKANFSATPGANDINGTNPNFVDSTRCVHQWWIQTQGGTGTGNVFNDTKSAIAYIASDPSTRIAACIAWIRAGYRPQASAYSSVTGTMDTAQGYTTDAAGNSLGGTIGAMAYLSSTVTGTGSVTLAAVSTAGAAGLTASATGSVTLAALSPVGSGGLTAAGSGAVNLAAVVAAGGASFATSATGSVSLAALAVAGAGSGSTPGTVTGTGSVTLAALALAGSGGFATTAVGMATLGPMVAAGLGGDPPDLAGLVGLVSVYLAIAVDPFDIDPNRTSPL